MRLVYDIEGDDLEEKCTTVHCIVTQDLDTQEVCAYGPQEIEAGIKKLDEADELWGHNIVTYDQPVLSRLHEWTPRPAVLIFDTLLASRQAYPGAELKKRDITLVRRGVMPGSLMMKPHSLEAWGCRLGLAKDTKPQDFSKYTPEMLEYCKRDVALNAKLVEFILTKTSREVILVESQVGQILFRQHKYGVGFNVEKAVSLSGQLAKRREELARELRGMFRPWYAPKGKPCVPKRDMESKKYKPGDSNYRNVKAGCEYQSIELVEFNPASGEHIALVLQKYRGWEPRDFTDGGLPKTEEKVLADLPWPECKLMVEYQRLKKLLGYISEGEQAWLKLQRNGRLHGRVHPTGTVTNRMSHVAPNLGQVPKVGKPFGAECRELFEAGRGKVIVGADASGLQMRMLGHYLAPFDGGAFARVVEDESNDVHLYMQEDTLMLRRDNKKTSNYAWLFGAGDYKLGTIAIFDMQNALELGEWEGVVPSLQQAQGLGRRVRNGIEAKLKMGQMSKQLALAAKRGRLRSLDGRYIPVLSQHKALNTLLMGGEAVVMKRALLIVAPRVYALGGEFVLNVHDEWQVECEEAVAEEMGKTLVGAITQAGQEFSLRCRLDGKYKIGKNWKETH